MADRTVDDDFRTFRATGDPDALGRVFDAVAPRLLLVAAQLAPHHAEDLVQTTFVRAIERAARFDPARPLWPWLVGILALEAKTTRRRDARIADPARLPTHVEPDPTDAAATTETAEHIAAAVEGLPEPFRQVCVLRLVHGLEPVQIARALGIPAETARSRLSRGLERLRRALPAGLAAAIAAALPREGLAAMRARVLELAASAGAQPAVAVGGSAATAVAMLGWWTMNKKIAALACAAVVAALAVPFGLSLGRPAPPPDAATAVPATRVAPHAVAERAATGDAGRGGPERVAVEAPAVPPPAAGTATLRGRCVDEDGAPLAGVTVTLHGRENGERAVQLQLETDRPGTPWADPEPAETRADGRFAFAFVPRPAHTFRLSIRAPGRPRLSGFWSKIDPAETVDVGDVVVRPGVRIRGRVLDAQGAPVGERAVHVDAGMTRPGRQGRFDAASSASGRTDARGWFDAREPVPAGRYWISVEGHRVVAPAGGVAVAEPTAAIEVVVEPASADDRPRIAGVVVAASGVPIAGAEIRVERGGPGPLRSGGDGSFEIRREARWPRPMPDDAVSVSVGAAGHVTWTSPVPVPWGTLDLRIELADGPPLTIRATRADDETPVERYGIVLMPLRDGGGTSSDDWALKHVGDHPDGVLALDRASTGRFLLSVVPPPSTGLAPSTDREIEVEPGFPLRIDVPVPRLAARVVEVVTADGTPIAGARVELLEPRDGGEVRTTTIALEASAARYNPPSVAALHDAASTDPGGRATVHGRAGQSFALRLPGPGHVPTVVPAFRTDDAEPARVVVGVGGTLRGRIGPPEVFAMLRTDAGLPPTGPVDESARHLLPAVGLRGVGPRQGERFPAGMGSGSVLVVDPDGGFALSGVPPGTWEMQLRVPMSIPLLAATTARRIGDTVEIAEGEVRDVEVDLQAWLRQAVALEVRVDGAPFSGRLQLEGDLGTRGDGEPDTAQAFAQTDSDGLATAALRAGTWEVIVIVPRRDGEWLRMPGPTFRVVRGTPQLVGVDVRTASRRVVVLGPDGEPVDGLALSVRSAGAPFGTETAPTDADGHTIVFGPPGTVVLRARRRALRADAAFYAWLRSPDRPPTDDGLVDVGSVVLVSDPAEPATVRLPPTW